MLGWEDGGPKERQRMVVGVHHKLGIAERQGLPSKVEVTILHVALILLLVDPIDDVLMDTSINRWTID